MVMVAFTVAADVTGDVGYDIDGNYSYYQYPLFYWGNTNNGVLSGGVYSEYMTPTLTEEQIAEGISFADMMVEGNPTMEILRTCTGIEVPILTFMRNDYTWMLEHVGGHVYVENCEPYCTVCRKEKVEIHHLYDSECDTRCNYCSATRVVDDHDYGAWVTVKPATETETGLRKSNCRICGHEETTVIPMLNTAGGNDAADGADSENQGNNNVTEPEQDNTMLVIYISVGAAVLLVVVVVILIIAKGSKKKAKAEKQEP